MVVTSKYIKFELEDFKKFLEEISQGNLEYTLNFDGSVRETFEGGTADEETKEMIRGKIRQY